MVGSAPRRVRRFGVWPEVGEELSDHLRVHRLDEVVVEAGLLRPPPVGLLAPAGQGHQQQARQLGLARSRRATS